MNDLEKYYSCRDDMSTGDVILYESDDPIGRAIRLFTPKSHTSLVVRLRDYEGKEKRRFILEANAIHGIIPVLLSKKLENYSGRAWWYPLRPEFEPVRRHIGTWAFGQIGVKYDFGGLFLSALGRVSESARALFCSEFAFAADREGVEGAILDGIPQARDCYNLIFNDWEKIKFKAAWPGDFEKFTGTYRLGGQLI